MTPVDLSKLPEYLRAQRWFNGKAWPIKSVSVVDHATVELPGRPFVLAIVEVTYELGQPERYLLPVRPRGEGIEDALEDDDCMRALLALIREERAVPSGSGRVVGEWIGEPAGAPPSLPAAAPVRRMQVEQSNTSVVFGEKVILKVIRRLETGINPEYEIGRFLATRTSFRATPAMVGALKLEGPAATSLALVHRFVPDAVDGWRHVLDGLRASKGADPRLLEAARELGGRVGELHAALASDASSPGFKPEALQQEDLQRWSASIIGELGVTFADAARVRPEIEDRREALLAYAHRLAHVQPSGQKIRIHGDLHLGQVLRAEGSWLIFDFEGEPARSFNQRREKTSPLKDVAGMLRSFDYAAGSLQLEGTAPPGGAAGLRRAFLEGYRAAARGAPFLPQDEEALETALGAFELEKLLYEIRYEIQNRPAWVEIPLQALMRMEVSS